MTCAAHRHPDSADAQTRRVVRVVGLQRAAIYSLMREGRFPQAVRITARSVGWIESEIQEWLAEKVRERAAARKPKSGTVKKP
jgi:prophage regulatory protein